MKQIEKQGNKFKTLFLTFFKIGLFTFGGGYAMIPLIEYEIVERHKWIETKDILDIFAIAESTPGVIAINTATFVGYKVAGFWGSLLATLGVAIPSFVIISIISLFFVQFQNLEWVAYAFNGIRAGVIVLILGAVVKMGQKGQYNPLTIILLVLAFLLASFTQINVVFLILGGAIVGLVYQVLLKKNPANNNHEVKK
ncbi:chromate transporter [Acetobacterium bakii]|uniref:chromate transporter n=1 Tax=Acetobacterium bakii TaxID=52689 RepID=UPI001FA74476|nr:chromate transporter [Acetobacterium bakii]